MPFTPINTQPSSSQATTPLLPKITANGAQIVNPVDRKKEISLEEGTRLSTKEGIDRAQEIQFLNQISPIGKPIVDLTVDDLYKASNGNLRLSKSMMDLINAAKSGQTGMQKSGEALSSVMSELSNLAQKIPTESGPIGKLYRGPANKIKESVGLLPEAEVYTNLVSMALPLFRKAFGDSGNIGQQEQVKVEPALKQLASPQIEVRKLGQEALNNIFSKVFGKTIDFNASIPKAIDYKNQKDALKEMSTEDLMRLLK